MVLPVSAIIPTRNRPESLQHTLESLSQQTILPAELIIIDGSTDQASRIVVETWASSVATGCGVTWQPAKELGAAVQRNQGIAMATQPFIWFFDDDIVFEPQCVCRLWNALQSDVRIGGVNAMIVNQRYQSPGLVSRVLFTLLHGRREKSFAGKVIGPAVNLLPEDREDLPEIVPVEWLNTTCTMYRHEALPTPPFDTVFTGYSMMEDLALSLRVGRKWRLANARTARIFHDSQTGIYKSDARAMATMALVNRYYVMTRVLGDRRPTNYLRLLLWEVFQLMTCAISPSSRKRVLPIMKGQWMGVLEIWRMWHRGTRKHAE